MVFRQEGGFVPGKVYELCYGSNLEKKVSLSGDWNYEIIHRMESLPQMTFSSLKHVDFIRECSIPSEDGKSKDVSSIRVNPIPGGRKPMRRI